MDLSMDIASLSTSMSMSQLSVDLGAAILGKTLDQMETQGDGVQKILESSVTPWLGGAIDLSV